MGHAYCSACLPADAQVFYADDGMMMMFQRYGLAAVVLFAMSGNGTTGAARLPKR
jgi:hypothetical protein